MAAASRSCVSEQKAGSQQQPCGEVRHSGKYPEVLKFSTLPAAAFFLSDHSNNEYGRQKQQVQSAVIVVKHWHYIEMKNDGQLPCSLFAATQQ